MRVLVTGAAGFIGRPLVKALEAAGHTVLGWDLPNEDITRPFLYPDGSSPVPLDALIHLAAIASPPLCDKNPALAFQVNVQATHNVLKLAVASGAKRFVLASSAHVYNISPKYLPTDERAPLAPFDTYTTTKLLSENLCNLFWENYGLSYAAIRLFNGYGPGQQLGYFIPDKIQQAQKGSFVLKGSDITKDWVFIDDVVRAYILAVESKFVGPVNVGTGVETDLGSIARIIGRSYETKVTTYAAERPSRMCADWRRAKDVLGWEPKVNLEEGLRATFAATSQAVPV